MLCLKDLEFFMCEDALPRAELFQNYIHQMQQFDSKSYKVMSQGCVCQNAIGTNKHII